MEIIINIFKRDTIYTKAGFQIHKDHIEMWLTGNDGTIGNIKREPLDGITTETMIFYDYNETSSVETVDMWNINGAFQKFSDYIKSVGYLLCDELSSKDLCSQWKGYMSVNIKHN